MKVPLIDFSRQQAEIGEAVHKAAGEVLTSQQFILGSRVRKLEELLAEDFGAAHGIGVASGSDALFLALLAIGVGPGDEVITTPFTFFATAGSIVRTGAKPVFSDAHPETFNLDPRLIEKRLTAKTKAILPVHLFGLPCDMDEILRIASTRGIKVIEDAAQATGAVYQGNPVGGLADAACLSFFPTKNLGGAGDGGMVLTSDPAITDRVRVLRTHGSKVKYFHDWVGVNSRLDELQAAILLAKYPRLNGWNQARRRAAAIYREMLFDLPITLQSDPADRKHVYHLFSFTTDQRDALKDYLTARGIGCGVYYPIPLHLQNCFKSLGYQRGDYPVSEMLCEKILSIPMYPEITDEECRTVANAIRDFYRQGPQG